MGVLRLVQPVQVGGHVLPALGQGGQSGQVLCCLLQLAFPVDHLLHQAGHIAMLLLPLLHLAALRVGLGLQPGLLRQCLVLLLLQHRQGAGLGQAGLGLHIGGPLLGGATLQGGVVQPFLGLHFAGQLVVGLGGGFGGGKGPVSEFIQTIHLPTLCGRELGEERFHVLHAALHAEAQVAGLHGELSGRFSLPKCCRSEHDGLGRFGAALHRDAAFAAAFQFGQQFLRVDLDA